VADINLLNTTHTILSRDQFGYLWIQYTLDAIPSDKWNKIFSRQSSLYSIYQIRLTNKIQVYLTPFELTTEDIIGALNLRIQQTNEEINSDALKIAIILSKFENGMIVAHNGMHFTTLHTVPAAPVPITVLYLNQYRDDLQFNRDHYESYVTAIANRL
jgi:hypothetical protein